MCLPRASTCAPRRHSHPYAPPHRHRNLSSTATATGGPPSFRRHTGFVRLSYNPYFSACFFSMNSVFSHNKSTGTVFRLVFSAKRTGPLRKDLCYLYSFIFELEFLFRLFRIDVSIWIRNPSYSALKLISKSCIFI